MALLSSQDRADLVTEICQRLSNDREAFNVAKTIVRNAVDAADQWVEDNSASFNTALPAGYRTVATAAQKADLLAQVLRKRYKRA